RVEQHRDVVDAAVHRAALDADDVRDRAAFGGGGAREIGRRRARLVGLEAVVRRLRSRRARIGQRGRATRRGGPVEELVLGRDVALRVDREGGQAAGVRGGRIAHGGNGGGRRADPRRGLRPQA